MNAQQITGRLLQSLSADKNALIDGYLLAFGVTKIGKYELPPVFKSIYEPEWEAFIENFHLKLHEKSAAKEHLYRILEFVRYMQASGLNPFAKPVKHPRETKLSSSTKFKSLAVYEQIVESSLRDINTEVVDLLRKTQLSVLFKPSKQTFDILFKDGTYMLVINQILVPAKKNASLDGVLTNLQSLVYNGSSVPIQLREQKQTLPKESRLKPKVLNDKAETLVKNSSMFGWYPLRKTKSFMASLVRAKEDRLVFKAIVYLELDVNLGASTKNTLLKLWKKITKPT